MMHRTLLVSIGIFSQMKYLTAFTSSHGSTSSRKDMALSGAMFQDNSRQPLDTSGYRPAQNYQPYPQQMPPPQQQGGPPPPPPPLPGYSEPPQFSQAFPSNPNMFPTYQERPNGMQQRSVRPYQPHPYYRSMDDSMPIQGDSRRTASFHHNINSAQVSLANNGRPMFSNIEVWQGPDNTAQSVKVYNEDGRARPLRTIINTPGSNAVSIKNDGRLEFPFAANVQASPQYHNAQYNHNFRNDGMANPYGSVPQTSQNGPSQGGSQGVTSKIIQGGASSSISFQPPVSSVEVTLTTEGRPLKAVVELLQGPTSAKQVWDIDSQDGEKRPFSAIIESAQPGASFAIRVRNIGQMEFPLTASIRPYEYDHYGMGAGPNMFWS